MQRGGEDSYLHDMNGYERSILAAQGYLELGMFPSVWQELQDLPAEYLGRSDVLEILTLSLMGQLRWGDALKVARRLRQEAPEEPGGFIHEAYCLHELGETKEALEVLLHGPASLHTKAVYFYNIGCYHARLGDPVQAMRMLEKSFEMDASLRRTARRDPDLVTLKNEF
jgi:tetratricopeptide (TPR) repeat protein